MMLLLGVLLIAGAVGCGYVAFNGVPVGRVASARIDRLAVNDQPNLLTRAADSVADAVEGTMRRRGWRPFSARELELAGVSMSAANLVVTVSCLSIFVLALATVLANVLLGLLLALIVPFATKAWLSNRAARQRRKFAAQLPQALQMMAASLRAGHSLPRVLDSVSSELEAPVGEELARVVNENRLGRDLVEAIEDVAARMQSDDFRWVGAAISAQRETGGNLNEILDQVAETIRERQHIRMQVMSLSAEGRLSAMILMALPVGIGVYYSLVSSEIMSAFVGAPIGKVLIAASLVMYVLGGLWMRSIVRIEF